MKLPSLGTVFSSAAVVACLGFLVNVNADRNSDPGGYNPDSQLPTVKQDKDRQFKVDPSGEILSLPQIHYRNVREFIDRPGFGATRIPEGKFRTPTFWHEITRDMVSASQERYGREELMTRKEI